MDGGSGQAPIKVLSFKNLKSYIKERKGKLPLVKKDKKSKENA